MKKSGNDSSTPKQRGRALRKTSNASIFSQHDTPPPLVLLDGSFAIETDDLFTEDLSHPRKIYRRAAPLETGKIEHIKVIHGSGDLLYRDLFAGGSQIDIWFNEDPNDTDIQNISIMDKVRTSSGVEISSDKQLTKIDNTGPGKKKRPKRITHSGPTAASFRVTRIRIHKRESGTNSDRILFEVTAPPNVNSQMTPEEYRVMTWLERALR